MSEPTRLILWDIDGTLISAGPVARRAFDAAVTSVLGMGPIDHGVSMSGKTDPQIALEILARMAVGEDEAHRHLPGVLRALERELEVAAEAIRRDGAVHRGARALLRELHRDPRVIQTVLTGNLAANARLKLGAFGLDPWVDLEVGAYGSDHHDRTRLVPVARGKVEERYGVRVPPDRTWVIGDTPLDLMCARAGGARCLLVGTGRAGMEPLQGLKADAVLPDLGDTATVLRLLLEEGEARGAAAAT